MKIQKKWLYILLTAAGVFGVVTILFFSGEKWLRDGWYYIPDRAIAIALGFCVFWQIVQIGVSRAKLAADEADLIIYVVDGSRELDENDYQGTGDRGGGISVPVFGIITVSLQSWI